MKILGALLLLALSGCDNLSPSPKAGATQSGCTDLAWSNTGYTLTALASEEDRVSAAALDPLCSLYVTGFTQNGDNVAGFVRKFLVDGNTDSGFQQRWDASSLKNSRPTALNVSASGQVLVGGVFGAKPTFGLTQFSADGTTERGFGIDGKVITAIDHTSDGIFDVGRQNQDKIIATGRSLKDGHYRIATIRYNTWGEIDTTFGQNGISLVDRYADQEPRAMTIDDQDHIWIAGFFVQDGKSRPLVARYLADGDLDGTFGSGGIESPTVLSDRALDIVAQSNGRVLTLFPSLYQIINYTASGALYTPFGDGGVFTSPLSTGIASSITVDLDGRIVVAGTTTLSGQSYIIILRLTSDGTLDTSFASGGYLSYFIPGHQVSLSQVLIQGDRKILLVGKTVSENASHLLVVRLRNDGKFDSKGRS